MNTIQYFLKQLEFSFREKSQTHATFAFKTHTFLICNACFYFFPYDAFIWGFFTTYLWFLNNSFIFMSFFHTIYCSFFYKMNFHVIIFPHDSFLTCIFSTIHFSHLTGLQWLFLFTIRLFSYGNNFSRLLLRVILFDTQFVYCDFLIYFHIVFQDSYIFKYFLTHF